MAENKTYDELFVGQSASVDRKVTDNDLWVFARSSGNFNPVHRPDFDYNHDGHADTVAPSMWLGALVSAVFGNVLPGPGTLYREQSLMFHGRVQVGDTVTVSVTVKEKQDDGHVVFDTTITCNSALICSGEAVVLAPNEKVTFDGGDFPELIVGTHVHVDALIDKCEGLPPMATAIVAPEDENSLGGALLAHEYGLITPLLVGDPAKIHAVAASLGKSLDGMEIIEAPTHGTAAARSVALVHENRAAAVMKGYLHTDELLRHVVKRDGGLRAGRRLSHVFIMDVPGRDEPLMVSDAAINIAPDLSTKVDITQNAIDVALAIGIEEPRAAVLSAVETVNEKIPSTLEAAALSKMADRGQIKGGCVDGPLAMDNALSPAAARTKKLTGSVAGRANILIVPNLEAGNMVAKELAYAAHAESAGLVVGASVPVILTSRADGDRARLASCAVAALYDTWAHPERDATS
ncbi:MAG: bifunctional enoyl-CoA hydratase/phosphate acetyltransferase [Pseudomonadota bacterium]